MQCGPSQGNARFTKTSAKGLVMARGLGDWERISNLVGNYACAGPLLLVTIWASMKLKQTSCSTHGQSLHAEAYNDIVHRTYWVKLHVDSKHAFERDRIISD